MVRIFELLMNKKQFHMRAVILGLALLTSTVGLSATQVEIYNFKNSLKIALKIPSKIYEANTNGQFKLKSRVDKIEVFIDALEDKEMDIPFLDELRNDLVNADQEPKDFSKFLEINKKINNIVDDFFSTNNIHHSHFKIPMILASFKKIPAGSFIMGSPSTENKRDKNEKQVKVTISKSFEMMTTEVTQLQWFLVMKKNPGEFTKIEHCVDQINIDGHDICPSMPVDYVSWDDVKKYISKLNDWLDIKGCAGTPKDPKGCYRLPTEAEWEYAARGGIPAAYSFGNDLTNLTDHAHYLDNSDYPENYDRNAYFPRKLYYSIGLKKPNPYGLYDIHGNVWEWVEDLFRKKLKGETDPLQNDHGPYGPFSKATSNNIIRGGSANSKAQELRSANRRKAAGEYGYFNVGFRLVRNL